MTDAPALPPPGEGRPDPVAFGRALPRGVGINLLVTDVEASARFAAEVLGARVSYRDADVAIVAAEGAVWMLHHDRTYHAHPLGRVLAAARGEAAARGLGAELRLYGRDPDAAEAAARAAGHVVLAAAADKPHGLREVYLVDPDGYLWVACVPSLDG